MRAARRPSGTATTTTIRPSTDVQFNQFTGGRLRVKSAREPPGDRSNPTPTHGGKSGEVRVSLAWNTEDELDPLLRPLAETPAYTRTREHPLFVGCEDQLEGGRRRQWHGQGRSPLSFVGATLCSVCSSLCSTRAISAFVRGRDPLFCVLKPLFCVSVCGWRVCVDTALQGAARSESTWRGTEDEHGRRRLPGPPAPVIAAVPDLRSASCAPSASATNCSRAAADSARGQILDQAWRRQAFWQRGSASSSDGG